MELCAKFYPEIFKSMKNIAEYKKLDAKSTFPHELIKKFTKSTSSFREIRINFDKSTLEKRGNVMILDHTLLRTWFSSTGHAKYILDTYKCTLQAAKQIPVKRNENDREIEDILGLN